jgi:ribosomal protein L21E
LKNINENYANAENVEIKLKGSIQNSEIHRFLESKKPEKVDDPLHSVYKFLIEKGLKSKKLHLLKLFPAHLRIFWFKILLQPKKNLKVNNQPVQVQAD